MSVLIKGMEMPKNCGECQFCHTENFKIYCCPTDREDIFYDAIPEWCPLVQIPPITDEQISDAFQVAIANYWEEKSKYLTPPPVPYCDCKKKEGEQNEID
jgi:hypothetical protein